MNILEEFSKQIKIRKCVLFGFMISIILGIFLYARAQSVFSQVTTVDPAVVAAERAKLEEELKGLESQIDGYRSLIQDKQNEAVSLERDLSIIQAEIKKAKLAIQARTFSIKQLTETIGEKSEFVGELLRKINREKESLAELLRQLNVLGDTTLVELMLGYENISDFFVDVDSMDSVQKLIHNSLGEIEITKTNTEEEVNALQERKQEESDLKAIQELEKRRTEQKESEQKNILKITRGQEKAYQTVLKSSERDAAKIRSQLFLLRGSAAIPFEKAIEYANLAFQKTGVRPAFLLGILSEESELGANLGSGNWQTDLYNCYLRIGYKTSAEKQKKAFLEITAALGMDPNLMPVSKAPYYGCGGAMGPAQFMPTTWQLYQDAIAAKTGHNPPSPWDPKDAFMASALLLKDNGAAAGGVTAERRAALKYLAGGNWQKKAYAFYGDDVMALANKYQQQIDILAQY
ncbi:MAG: lytic murein transglycosylase [Candidatus Niyogibacteria bacterium]|nr:lytic murein transglycosylase [Candidatus Niyogibacteria bacterium]